MIRSPFPLLSQRPKIKQRLSQVCPRVVQVDCKNTCFDIFNKNKLLQNFVPGGPGGPGGFSPITYARARVGGCFLFLIFSFVEKTLDHMDRPISCAVFRMDRNMGHTWTTWDTPKTMDERN